MKSNNSPREMYIPAAAIGSGQTIRIDSSYLPRTLVIDRAYGGDKRINVALYDENGQHMLAWCAGDGITIESRDFSSCLWCGSASFELHEADAESLRAQLQVMQVAA